MHHEKLEYLELNLIRNAGRSIMPDADYLRCRFSITCHTDDLAIVHCLRSLCEFAEEDGLPQIGWGGTKRSNWESDNHQITLRFTNPRYREAFINEARRLLPKGSWSEVRRSDNDPAHRQRR
jgi:hypothetical protein